MKVMLKVEVRKKADRTQSAIKSNQIEKFGLIFGLLR